LGLSCKLISLAINTVYLSIRIRMHTCHTWLYYPNVLSYIAAMLDNVHVCVRYDSTFYFRDGGASMAKWL
jgi:hypothetical protein